MSKREKLIERMKNNPKDVPFEDIDSLLIYYGFTRQGTKHYFYTHPAVSEVVTIPRHKPIKAVYIERALRVIDEVKEVINNE